MMIIDLTGILASIALPAARECLPGCRLTHAARNLYSHVHNTRMGVVLNKIAWAIVLFALCRKVFVLKDSGFEGLQDPLADNDILNTINPAHYGSNMAYVPGNALDRSHACRGIRGTGIVLFRRWFPPGRAKERVS